MTTALPGTPRLMMNARSVARTNTSAPDLRSRGASRSHCSEFAGAWVTSDACNDRRESSPVAYLLVHVGRQSFPSSGSGMPSEKRKKADPILASTRLQAQAEVSLYSALAGQKPSVSAPEVVTRVKSQFGA